jgi:HEPN domain-containing protein
MNEEIVTEWLKSAQLDLASIHYLIDKEHLTPIVAFHAQQAIEKTIKGLLESKNLRVPKTHKLQSLFALADVDFEFDNDLLIILDDLYIDARYPGELGLLPEGNPSIADTKKFQIVAEYVFETVCNQLSIKAR